MWPRAARAFVDLWQARQCLQMAVCLIWVRGIGSCWPTGVCGWAICVTSYMIRGLLGLVHPAGWQLSPWNLRQDSQMILARDDIIVEEWVPQNGCCQHLSPQEALQDQQMGLTQAPFKLLSLFWDLGVFGNLQVLLKSRVYVLYSHLTNISPKHRPSWFSKPDILGAHLPSAGPLN